VSFWYVPIIQKLAQAQLDMREAGHDLRLLLVMANSTADTDEDAEFIANITTLDEFDGSGYVRKALASQAVNLDTVNDRAEFDAADVTWTTLGAGTRQIKGLVLFRFVSNDADSPVIAYLDGSVLPANGNGGDFIATWNAQGTAQLVAA